MKIPRIALIIAVPVMAHHSFMVEFDDMAEFDEKKPVTHEGVVTKVDWMNPHTLFYIDEKDKNGGKVNWRLETGSPNALIARGWSRGSMKKGDRVTVYGYLAKERTDVVAARSVTLANGRTVFSGQTDDGGPDK